MRVLFVFGVDAEEIWGRSYFLEFRFSLVWGWGLGSVVLCFVFKVNDKVG